MELKRLIQQLASRDLAERDAAAEEIYIAGSILARRAAREWLKDGDFHFSSRARSKTTVGIAVQPELFRQIRAANGSPRLAEVPPDQDAEEFECILRAFRLMC